jgi:hypothetical protein
MPKPIVMPYDAFVREHKRLIQVLESNSRKQMRSEAQDQKRELAKYLKRRR